MNPYRSKEYRVSFTPGMALFLVWDHTGETDWKEHIPGQVRRDEDGFYIIDVIATSRGGLSMDDCYYGQEDYAESIARRLLNDYVQSKENNSAKPGRKIPKSYSCPFFG